MRLMLVAILFLWTLPSLAQVKTQKASASLTGRWLIAMEEFDSPTYWAVQLTDANGSLSGKLDTDPIADGTVRGKVVKFVARDPKGGYEDVTGTLAADFNTFSGTVIFLPEAAAEGTQTTHKFTASREPVVPATPTRHEFVPTQFHRVFSATIPPVMHVFPGDTIHTTTVDAGGTDEHGVRRSGGGNPQTGPFYVETAMPGDTLVVHIKRLKLNRDTAISDDGLVDRVTNPDLARKLKDIGNDVTWHLDVERGVATSTKPGEHLKEYTVPLRPMLGCVATAPRYGSAIPTGDSGPFGGNMDFNEVVEGNTVYLPVSNPGALLFFGDGHAAQGDGELNGNALETSMDVEITVDVIHGIGVPAPFLSSPTHLMTMALAGSVDDAMKGATDTMSDWLKLNYALTPSEIAQVLGTAAEYRISEVADRNAGVVLKLSKERLAKIPQTVPASAFQ